MTDTTIDRVAGDKTLADLIRELKDGMLLLADGSRDAWLEQRVRMAGAKAGFRSRLFGYQIVSVRESGEGGWNVKVNVPSGADMVLIPAEFMEEVVVFAQTPERRIAELTRLRAESYQKVLAEQERLRELTEELNALEEQNT